MLRATWLEESRPRLVTPNSLPNCSSVVPALLGASYISIPLSSVAAGSLVAPGPRRESSTSKSDSSRLSSHVLASWSGQCYKTSLGLQSGSWVSITWIEHYLRSRCILRFSSHGLGVGQLGKELRRKNGGKLERRGGQRQEHRLESQKRVKSGEQSLSWQIKNSQR